MTFKASIPLILLPLVLSGCQAGSVSSVSSASPGFLSSAPIHAVGTTQDSSTQTLPDGTVRTVTTSTSGGFAFSFNSGGGMPTISNPLSFAGRWEIKSNFAKSCQLQLGTLAMGQNYQAQRSGFCMPGFDRVTQWSVLGNQMLLLDAQGQVRGRLSSDGSGGFTGTFDDGVFSPETVTMRRV